jgi:hypothetical protein
MNFYIATHRAGDTCFCRECFGCSFVTFSRWSLIGDHQRDAPEMWPMNQPASSATRQERRNWSKMAEWRRTEVDPAELHLLGAGSLDWNRAKLGELVVCTVHMKAGIVRRHFTWAGTAFGGSSVAILLLDLMVHVVREDGLRWSWSDT